MWSLLDSDVDRVATVKLPDGRTVMAHSTGYVEGDTNAFVEESFTVTDTETSDELSLEELNREITVEGKTYFLHEYISEVAKWEEN